MNIRKVIDRTLNLLKSREFKNTCVIPNILIASGWAITCWNEGCEGVGCGGGCWTGWGTTKGVNASGFAPVNEA
jgi:hypothetical protein